MRLELIALQGIPEVHPGDDVGKLILQALIGTQCGLQDGDILAVAQKVVSKAEGRFRRIDDIVPSPRAQEIAQQCGKDPRKVQAILDESSEIVRIARRHPEGVVIARHRQGWVCANAGIDESNLGVEGQLLLLPLDADESAARIAKTVDETIGVRPGIVVTDTFGRPWRKGLVNIAIGTSEVQPLLTWIGRNDAYGRPLAVTEQAMADEIAAAAGLLMVKDSSSPVVLLRGLDWARAPGASCRQYVRQAAEDLFT